MTCKKYRNKLKRYYLKQGLEFKIACYAAKHGLHLALKHYGWLYVGAEQDRNTNPFLYIKRFLYVKEADNNMHHYIVTENVENDFGCIDEVLDYGFEKGNAKEILVELRKTDQYYSTDDSWKD